MIRLTFADYTARLRDFVRRSSPGAPFSEGLSAAETDRDRAFNELAVALFGLQFDFVKQYRRFCETRSTSGAVAHWTQIPAIPISAFKEMEVSSLEPSERTAVFHSSGTTTQIHSRHFHDAGSLAVYEASLLPWFQRYLLADSPGPLRMLFLTPPPLLAPNSSLVYMFETVRREFGSPDSLFAGRVDGSGAWVLDGPQIRRELARTVESGRPIALLGTAFNFVHLLDEFAGSNVRFQLPAGSRVMETGGYKGRSRTLEKSELHSLMMNQLGVPAERIVCEYGMSELSSQAYEGEVQSPKSKVQSRVGVVRAFRFPPWARVQVISPETGREVENGESGLIRVFDLANVRSVMAIQTEDLGIRRGAGFELLGRARQAEPRGCSLMVA